MRVRINHAGKHHTAAEVGGFLTFRYEKFGTGVVANIDELAVSYDNCFSPGSGFIDCVNLPVYQHPIGRRYCGWLFLAAGDQ
jgi:hypothetical protein